MFFMLNLELTYTLPAYQIAWDTDMMAHIIERYFANAPNVDLIDRLCESALRTIAHNLMCAI